MAFVVDLALFQLLYAWWGVGAVTARLASTLVSMTVAYVGHRFWSFSRRDTTRGPRGYLLFALINGLTLALGLSCVALMRYGLGHESALVLQSTNVASIAIGTVIRYFAYRRWVFPKHADQRQVQPAPTELRSDVVLPVDDGLRSSRPA